jgi:hypothetical protein
VSLEIVINEIKKNLPKLDREVWTHISLTWFGLHVIWKYLDLFEMFLSG